MTTSRVPSERTSFTSPVIDYEPAPEPVPAAPAVPAAVAGRATPPHSARAAPAAGRHRAVREAPPPRAVVVFADAALRRVLEVIDRRRPIAQLRPLLAPALIDTVVARSPRAAGRDGAAVLRRVRLRTAAHDEDGSPSAAEVFATYTRGRRVRAIAARVEV